MESRPILHFQQLPVFKLLYLTTRGQLEAPWITQKNRCYPHSGWMPTDAYSTSICTLPVVA